MAMNPRLLRPILSGDPDALRYIAAVQKADQQSLEPAVRRAINDFIVGCKQDGIWNAIKASCLLCGARTLAGALVPLKGAAPTNNNFVAADYNRETGLVGNGSTKYLNASRNNNADPQNNQHLSCYASSVGAAGSMLVCSSIAGTAVGHSNILHGGGNNFFHRSRSAAGTSSGAVPMVVGFHAISRAIAASYTARTGGTSTTISTASDGVAASDIEVFRRAGLLEYSTARINFYSIGESLDLALLDTRVSALITAIGAAI